MSGCGCGCTAQARQCTRATWWCKSKTEKGTPPWVPLPSPRSVGLVDLDLRALSIWAGRWMSSQ